MSVSVTCSLTPGGEAVVAERRARSEQRWQAALADFEVSELAVAAAVLDRLRALYDDVAGDEPDRPAARA